MFQYYKETGQLHGDIEEMILEMKRGMTIIVLHVKA